MVLVPMGGLKRTQLLCPRPQLVVNADRIDANNNRFDGSLDIGGGFLHRLTINLSDSNEAWVMDGTLNLNGAVLNSTKLSGSPVEISGIVNASNLVGITADAAFSDSSEMNFDSGTTVLWMQGQTTIAPGTTFTGDGILENGTGGVMSLEAGFSSGQVGVRNRGRLQSDNIVGVVAVDRFENFAGATLVVDAGKNNIGTDSEVLSISSGTAELAGDLQPRVIALSGTPAPITAGDSFTVLTAVGGLDLEIWETNYGMTASLPFQTAVPEPSSLLLFASVLLLGTTVQRYTHLVF